MANKIMRKFAVSLLAFALLLGLMPATFTARAAERINKTEKTLYVGDTVKLKVVNASDTVSWKSSNKAVASVGKTGKVTAKKAGTAKITATVGKAKYVSVITVLSVYGKVDPVYMSSYGQVVLPYAKAEEDDLEFEVYDDSVVSDVDYEVADDGQSVLITFTGKYNGTTYVKVENEYNDEETEIEVNVDGLADEPESEYREDDDDEDDDDDDGYWYRGRWYEYDEDEDDYNWYGDDDYDFYDYLWYRGNNISF